jgi:hypothetical protein
MELTIENYYTPEADMEYMSVSQYKRWLQCPAAAFAQYVTGTYKPETSDAMLAGSYFHGLFDGSAETFLRDNPELLTAKGLKTAIIKTLDDIFARVKLDAFFMNAVTGQHEEIYTAELFGIMWKCRVDVVNFDRGFFTDIKTVKDFALVWNDEKRIKQEFYIASGYDLQLAIYQKIIEKCTGHKLEPYIAAVTKEKTPDYDVIEFTGAEIDQHFDLLIGSIAGVIGVIKDIKARTFQPVRCEKCDYCKATKQLKHTTMARIN